MSETNSLKLYKIKVLFFTDLWLRFLLGINSVLNFLSLKKTKRFWGVVYDSVTKRPLDPVIVKLLYADGREVETCVTDMSGRYGFLAAPGKFKIFVKKSNYLFPSKYVAGDKDGVYKNLYHGEFFSLSEDFEVVAPNIPMDPLSFDWNQMAKNQMEQLHPYRRLFFKRLVAVFFWFGFALCFLNLWQLFPNESLFFDIVAGTYLFLIILSFVVSEARLWGQLEAKAQIPEAEEFLLELYNPKFSEISFGKAKVYENGKFLLRANKGEYLLAISYINLEKEKVFLGSFPITVGRNGVFNSTLVIG